jgi:hypothetical protein
MTHTYEKCCSEARTGESSFRSSYREAVRNLSVGGYGVAGGNLNARFTIQYHSVLADMAVVSVRVLGDEEFWFQAEREFREAEDLAK